MPRITLITLQLILVAGIIFVGGSLTHKLVTMDNALAKIQAAEKALESAEASDRPPHSSEGIQVIARRNIFKTPLKESPSETSLDIEALKPTELKLKLWGTITGEDGLTRAVIEDQTKREQALFRAGEEVASAKIKMILREKVVLSVNGEDEVLEIEKPTGRGGPGVVARTESVGPNVSAPVPPRPRCRGCR